MSHTILKSQYYNYTSDVRVGDKVSVSVAQADDSW